ncbi:32176_t:CDS:2 [Gigaspora margarita]|uniref:32176_t:CDS:1 n=1 Tax=Gigaspora margarita TaxID=4874 RepID=A0ABN7UXH4_GIGMA|nr:32176_t:CDS:2 [Gigaspora margarita]
MDLTFNSTIILNNTGINASSDTDHKILFSGISNETMINNQKSETFHDFDYGTPDLPGLPDKIKTEIFKYIRSPINLILACKTWYQFSKQSDARAKWIIVHFVRKNEKRDGFFKKIVGETIKSERNIKKVEVLNFLDQMMGNKSKSIFLSTMKMFKGKNPLYSIYGTSAIDDFQSTKSGSFTPCYKPLSFNPTFYNWILIKFSENSEIAKFAFNDILETRISFDLCQNSKEIPSYKFIEHQFIEIHGKESPENNDVEN